MCAAFLLLASIFGAISSIFVIIMFYKYDLEISVTIIDLLMLIGLMITSACGIREAWENRQIRPIRRLKLWIKRNEHKRST